MSAENSTEVYYALVKEAAESKRDENIPNSTMDHAEVGIRFLFANASAGSTIQIVSDEFFDEFWGRLKSVMVNFLKGSGKLEVVLLKAKNQLIGDLQKEFGSNVNVYMINDQILPKEKIPHVVVVSPVGYRVELSDELMKDKIVKGVLNFGDVKGTQTLKKFVDDLRSLSIAK